MEIVDFTRFYGRVDRYSFAESGSDISIRRFSNHGVEMLGQI